MSKIKDYQEQVQNVIEKGINTVETQHKSLAERPFQLAEKVEEQAKSYSVKSVHSKHNDYANTAYEALRVWNRRLGDYANSLISRFDKEGKLAGESASTSSSKNSSSSKEGGSSKQGSSAKSSSGASKESSTQQTSA